ncbi:MAG: enoyl-CoA hydratase-related protein [Deltaproteobacteria bacterium]
MGYENIIFQKQENIAVIKFNRPKALNAINTGVVADLKGALDEVEADDAIRVLIMTGEGDKAFVAGADISYMVNLGPLELKAFSASLHEVGFRMEQLPIPIIACVNGFALGGGTEISLACDFIYASETAKFGQPEINLGIIPGFGGTQRLPRRVGRGMAKELCMTGALISAQEAKDIGLVNKVFPADQLWEETMKTAKVIASKGRFSLMAAKRCIDGGYNMDLRRACAVEIDQFALCMASPDAKEGMSAFLEKRKPEFKGGLK